MPTTILPPATLLHYLRATSFKQLTALLATHNLSRTAKDTKAEVVEALHHFLTDVHVLTTIVAQLDANAKDALRRLLAADGALPVHPFESRFGPIRPYKPWRKADDQGVAQPWLAPISTTETLWYRGLLYRDPPKPQAGIYQHYVLPFDLMPHLMALLGGEAPVSSPQSPVPSPQSPVSSLQFVSWARPGVPADLMVHLGVWLASVNAAAVRPLHGRWLPPRVVAAICQRTGLDQAWDFQAERSERYLPYLAFLHYLVEVAEWAAGTTALALTPKGWLWLAAQPAARWQELWQAWLTADAEMAQPYRFRWHPFSTNARQFAVTELRKVPQDRLVALPDLLTQWRLRDSVGYLPAPYPQRWQEPVTEAEAAALTDFDPVEAFCLGPLFWLGVIDVAYPADPTVAEVPLIRLTPHGAWLLGIQDWSAPPAATAHGTVTKGAPNTLLLPVQMVPLHLAQLAHFCRWEAPTTNGTIRLEIAQQLTLDPARIGQAVAQSTHSAQILAQVEAALGRPSSRRLRQRLQRWAKGGQQLRLRELLVLESEDAALLARLQAHKLVRRRIDQTLGPQHVAINPVAAPGLAKTLETLDLYVDVPMAAGKAAAIDGYAIQANDDGATDDTNLHPGVQTNLHAGVQTNLHAGVQTNLHAGMQWLLLHLYRGLGEHVALPVPLPWDSGHALAARLTPMQRAAAESAANAILADLHWALDGYLRLPFWLMEHFDPTATLATLEQALADDLDVEIRYWSVSSGGPTVRTVSPTRLETRDGIPYLIGYCHLRQSERVFRVDRIEAVEVVGEPRSASTVRQK